jgi:spore germination protein GerM
VKHIFRSHRFGSIVTVLAILVAACGPGGTTDAGPVATQPTSPTTVPVTGSSTTTPGDTETSTTTTAVPVEQRFVDIFLIKDATYAVAVTRAVPATPEVAGNAIRALLAGPTDAELDGGLSSAIPADTLLLGISIEDGLATIDLGREFEAGGGSFSMLGRLAQVVYTLTQFPTIDSVRFKLDGQPVTVFSGEGILLEKPVTRGDYASILTLLPVPSGTTPRWVQADLPSLTGVPLAQQARVVLVADDDNLNVRTAPGVDNPIFGMLAPGAVVRTTHNETLVGNGRWVEVSTPDGFGWANARYLAAVVDSTTFAADARVVDVLDQMADIMAGLSDLTPVVSWRGLYVSHHDDPVRFGDLASLLTDPTTYKWPSNAIDVNDPEAANEIPSRTFAEEIAASFVSAYMDTDTEINFNEPIEAGNGRLAQDAIPFALQGFNYVAVYDPGDNPEYGGLDWTIWYVSFDYHNGRPVVIALTVDQWSP